MILMEDNILDLKEKVILLNKELNKKDKGIERLKNIINNMDKQIDNLCNNQKREVDRLNNDIKVLLKENEAKEKVIIKQNNIINELEKELKEYFNRIGENKKYVYSFYSQAIYNDIEHILYKLKELKEGE